MTAMVDLDELGAQQYCYLKTIGRVSGRPHQIEIWFGMKASSEAAPTRRNNRAAGRPTLYMLSGGRDRSDWVRNLAKKPTVTVRIGGWEFEGLARKVPQATDEDAEARRLLLDKYSQGGGDDLSEWGRNALPIAIELDVSSAISRAETVAAPAAPGGTL
jgi:hypothetical protein